MKKKVIALIIILLFGIGALLFGILGKPKYTDMMSLTDADLGKSVTVEIKEPLPIDDRNWILSFEDSEGNVSEVRIRLDEALSREFLQCVDSRTPLTGILCRESEDMQKAVFQTLADYVIMVTQVDALTDQNTAFLEKSLSPYCIEATDIGTGLIPTLKKAALIAGCVLLFAAILLLISVLSKKGFGKTVLVSLIVIAITVLIIAALFFNKIRTMCTIRSDGAGMYYMEYIGDYKLDDLLNANITSVEEFSEWLRREEFRNLPVPIDTKRFGCSSFKAKTPDGDVLMGRNFDYHETDALMIYSSPKNGYASYSMADLEVLGISVKQGNIHPDSPAGRLFMTAAPYAVCDGINEAGLGVSTLELDIGEIHQDTGKPDLYIYSAIRVLLDRCANVDEALKLLECYDIHSHANVRQHLFIADQSGRSVVVEWFDDQMYVNELDAVTNSVLTPGDDYDRGADSRLPEILAGLSGHDGILTPEQAKELLAKVAQENYTEWSCVYNLNRFTADVYIDEDFDHAYHYGKANG